jgi:phosphodiesterase/alkaline phosphatase D-like protein
VAMSIEGTTATALIGARNDRGGVGAAWVFTRTGTTWTQQGAKLTAKTPEEVGAGEFGASVALSVEGTTTTALIGAPGDNERVGAAWVFTRSGTTWTQQGAKLVAKSGEEIGAGEFGFSATLLAKEGTTALIGAPGDKEQIGAAWVFTRSGTTWTQQGAKLVAKSGEEIEKGEFGDSVAMSIESTTATALIGARGDKGGIGAAWVFTRSGTTWTQQGAKLVAKSGEETGTGAFGSGVALAVEGTTTTALIGASGDKEGIGAAWVFTRSGTTWTQQGAKLVAKSGEETGNGFFGSSVALSIESTTMTALIGAPHDNTDVGAAWVFTRTGTTWTQQGTKLLAKTPEEFGKGEFGATVALLAKEGTTALFGAPADNHGVGTAWAFARSGTTWTQQSEKLTPKSGEETSEEESSGKGAFGYSVALSSEGNTALIGGPPDLGVGAAWVFTRTGTTWTQQGAKLVAKSGEEIGAGEFGSSVALSADGSTALIGGYRDNADVGAAWVFTRSGTTWTQQGAKLVAKSGEESGEGEFGVSVALSADGNTALIGSSGEPLGFAAHRGAAWVFTRTGTTWAQQGGKLVSAETTGSSEFGFSVALAGSGNIALIGAPGDNTNVGAAWVYTRAGTTWTQQGTKILPKSGEETGEAHFGDTVALSSEGNTALIGGPFNKETTGAAWVFTSSGSTWTQQGEKLTPKSGEEIGAGEFGASLALGANGRAALIGAPQDNGNLGAAWMFTRSGSTWTQQATKILPKSGEEIGEGQFGYAVALSSEANTALIGGADDNNTIGAAWTFANTAPFVETKPATSITQTTATLSAVVNPDGVEVTTCEFEYGTSVAYGKTAKCGSGPGSGTTPVAVSAAITGLSANTTYHYRIIASNSGGSTQGQDETFKTTPNPPTVVTKPASAITPTTATLNGTVNPNGVEITKCEFEYGTSISYTKTAKCTALPGSGESPVAVSAPITGLAANTLYHFRLIAGTATAEGKGSDETFTTSPGAPVVETKPASSITYNSAVLNATVNPEGGEVTTCILEIATAEFYEANGKAYESGEECSSLPGKGTSPVAVSALAGVSAKTTYHFRILACSSTCSEGADLTFESLPNPPTVETKPASSITMTSATLNATVNPNSGTVGKCEFEYGTTVAYGKTAACVPSPGSGGAPVGVSASVTGLTAGTSYHFRIVAENAGGKREGADEAFTTVPNPPTVVTKPASSVTQTSATFTGTVNPNAGTITKCEFEYGTTVSYGKTAPCVPSTFSGSSPVAVSATVTGLTANTTYHYRLVASNAGGKGEGADETVKTLVNPPTVETKPASSITQTSVTLNGSVNPNGGEAKCEFEYGTTVSYGKTIACAPSTMTGSSPVAVSASVTGLTAGTTYHFRAVAISAGGKGEGADAMFQTSPALSAPTAVTGTGSSLTASVASVTGTVNPNNGPVTECEFEYGTTVSYGSAVPCRPTPGSGTSAVAVSAPIGGLAAGTTYHFRVSATNSAGNGVGSDQTFVTPASVHVHWYKSLNRVEEGKKVPFISWGTLSVSSSKGGASTECEVAASGYVENPVGASEGAFEMEGAETTQAFNAYDCTNSECEAEGGTAGLAGEGLPWSGALSEEVKGTFRLPSAGVQLYVHCRMASSPPTEKPGTGSLSAYEERRSSEYNLVGAATCTSNAGGSTKPKVANGSSLEKQTKLQFSGGAGGELECGAAGKLTTTGTVKMQGFTESELMSVKNP